MLSEETVRIMRERKQATLEMAENTLKHMQQSGYSTWLIDMKECEISVIKGEIKQLDIVLEEALDKEG